MWDYDDYGTAPTWAGLDQRGEHDETLAGGCDDLDASTYEQKAAVQRALDACRAHPTRPAIDILRGATS